MIVDDALRNREPEARSLALGGEIRLEYPRFHVFGHSRAVIADRDDRHLQLLMKMSLHDDGARLAVRPRGQGRGRVIEQVDDDSLDLIAIELENREFGLGLIA